jgi:putative heme-binding domain-containing protein
VYTQLQQSDARVAALSRELAGKFGDSEAAKQSLATLQDKKAPVDMRRKALLMLAERQRKELVAEIPQLLEEKDLRIETIRAIAGYDQEDLGKLLLKKYGTFTPEEKLELMQTLSSRPRYGWLLTRAIQDKTVPKPEVPAYVARQLRRVVGSGFVEVWGPIDALAAGEQAAEYTRYRKLLTDKALASASAHKGRALFTRTCGSCHKMYGEGGNIGPDITGSNRGNVEYLLSNILDPSGEIQDDYKLVVVTTRDGRTYSGNVSGENERQLTLRVVGQEAVVINKSDIQSREVTPVSMMPTGLFKTLTDAEILDLVKYLRTVEQVAMP